MKTLIVEDDYTSRRLIQKILTGFGDNDTAVDGQEAIEAFQSALDQSVPYDLVCLDIMLPRLDGQEVLKKIRAMEAEKGIADTEGVKIIMITALDDSQNIMGAFRSGCESYLVKPIVKNKLIEELKKLDLIEG